MSAKPTIPSDKLHDLIDASAKRHGVKDVAAHLDKAESTLRNELTRQPGYKLGLITALRVMAVTGDLSVLHEICRIFDLVAVAVPDPGKRTPVDLLARSSALAREFSQAVDAIARALEDGVVTSAEAESCIQETRDLIEEAVNLKHYLECLLRTLPR